jgi:hypothetical protein
MPGISATQKMKVGGSWFKISLEQQLVRFHLRKLAETWWYTSVIPTTCRGIKV